MNREKLQGIAATLGFFVLASGVGVTVWQALPDTTAGELRDAGVLDCPTRLVTCNWRIDDDGAAVLLDAGLSVPRGYRTLAARVKVCLGEDGIRDVVLPPLPQRAGQLAALASPDLTSCAVDPDPGGALWRTAASMCVAAPADGGQLCQRAEGDGGFRWFGAGNRMERSESNGHATCEDVPCAIFGGHEP